MFRICVKNALSEIAPDDDFMKAHRIFIWRQFGQPVKPMYAAVSASMRPQRF
jgi:hypothetical protein